MKREGAHRSCSRRSGRTSRPGSAAAGPGSLSAPPWPPFRPPRRCGYRSRRRAHQLQARRRQRAPGRPPAQHPTTISPGGVGRSGAGRGRTTGQRNSQSTSCARRLPNSSMNCAFVCPIAISSQLLSSAILAATETLVSGAAVGKVDEAGVGRGPPVLDHALAVLAPGARQFAQVSQPRWHALPRRLGEVRQLLARAGEARVGQRRLDVVVHRHELAEAALAHVRAARCGHLDGVSASQARGQVREDTMVHRRRRRTGGTSPPAPSPFR